MKIKELGLFLSLMCLGNQVFSQQIIAHRGASFLAPENTVASAKLGYELGADAVEIDIHLSENGKIMVNHDPTTKRTAVTHDYTISETTSRELRKLDVGSWKDKKYKGEKIPFLKEIFKVVPENKLLVIEGKNGAEIVPYLVKEIKRSGIRNRLMLISFNKDIAIQGKLLIPDIPVLWLLYNYSGYTMDEVISIAKKNNLDGLNVNHDMATPQFISELKQAGLDVYVYTVNDAEVAKKLRDLKVDGITSDRPKFIKDVITRKLN